MSINKMPSKSFQSFTKKLNNLENYSQQEKEIIFEKWQTEHYKYLKSKYSFNKKKV
jgi:hypothetical protein|tara:strand:- start:676 stop:843 length:168 start_codon:yes stop_codon:yes gene_type:complete